MTYQDAIKVFSYSNGKLIKNGKPIGAKRRDGYLKVIHKGKDYLVHRIIFLIRHGYLPPKLDHINMIRNDNRIENLRPCTDQQNQANSKTPKGKKSGLPKGVMMNGSRYQAQIKIDYKSTYLGTYETISAAKSAYDLAAYMYFGEFSRA